jgi:hypothetical protein
METDHRIPAEHCSPLVTRDQPQNDANNHRLASAPLTQKGSQSAY